jgi:tetratricopeptide (TPR) repeat protein
MGEFEQSARAFRKSLEFEPNNVKANLLLATALLQQGEKLSQQPDGKAKAHEAFAQAVLAAEKTLSLQREDAYAHLTRGKALMHLGRTDEGVQALRQAALAGSEIAEMHQALGEALAESGKLDEALKHLEHAVQLAKPGDTGPRDSLEKWKRKAKQP